MNTKKEFRWRSFGARVAFLGFSFLMTLSSARAQALNDNWIDAEQLFGNFGSVSNDNTTATFEANEPAHAGFAATASIWYKWTAPADGEVAVDTIGSGPGQFGTLDTVLAVYAGTNLQTLRQVAANDDIFPINQSNISGRDLINQPYQGPSGLRFNARVGETYYIAIDTKFGDVGPTVLTWAYKPSGVFRFATEDAFTSLDLSTFTITTTPMYQISESEEFGGEDSTFGTYYDYDVPGLLVTITRVAGSSGRMLVDYATADPLQTLEDDTVAVADTDYQSVQGTVAFDDFEMSKRIFIPIFSDFFLAASNRDFAVVLSNPRPDPNEAPDVAPPRVDSTYGTVLVRILDTDIDPVLDRNFDTNGVFADPTNSVFNFEKSHYVVPEDVNDYYTSVGIWVMRSGTNREGVTLNYRINNYLADDFDVDEEDNNSFPLTPGSDYATPTPPDSLFIHGTNSDFNAVQGTLTWGQDDFRPKRISLTITNDNLTEFNEDFHLFLYRIVNNTPVPVGTVNETAVTILFDDRDPPAGSVDEFYNADFGKSMAPPVNTSPANLAHPGSDGIVYSLLSQPDGRTLIGGNFLSYNGQNRHSIARVNLDGTLDISFNPGSGANESVGAIALANSGLIYVAGGFTSFNGTLRNRIARISTTGALDFSFNPGAGLNNAAWALAVQPDGKVVVAGEFTSAASTPRAHIARFNTNGGLDTSFDPGIGPDGTIWSMALQPDGKILIAGEFLTVGGTNRASIARLNSDGSLDNTFDPGTGTDGIIYTIALRPDGKIWIGGEFSSVNLTPAKRFARLNSDGSLDTAFDAGTSADNTVNSIALQPDGTVYVGGSFTSFNGTHRLGFTRLYADGTVDTTFLDTAYNQFAGLHRRRLSDPLGTVYTSTVQPDGGVLIGGLFDQVGGGQASLLVRTDVNDPLEFTNNVWVEPKARDGVRNRSNVAKLVGGATPGPGNVGLLYDTYAANEGQGFISVNVVRANGALGYASANFAIENGLAQSGIDYVYNAVPPIYLSSWLLRFPSSEANATTRMHSDGLFGTNDVPTDIYGHYWYDYTPGNLDVTLLNDNLLQGDRGTVFQLANPAQEDQFYLGGENIPLGVALGRSHSPFTVVDDDHQAGIVGFDSINFNVNENAGNATVTVTRTNGSYGSVSVAWATFVTTTNGVAATPNVDYSPRNGSVTFANGQTTRTFTIPIVNDTAGEDDEVIGVRLFNPNGTSIGLGTATVTIIDNDSPNGRVNLSSATYSTNENSGAAVITVNRSGGSQGTLTVQYATENGTAISGTDYLGATNTLVWNPGDTSPKTFTVQLIDNQIVDGPRTVNLHIFSPTVNTVTNLNVLGSISNAVLTITDNDALGSLAFSSSIYSVSENGGPAIISVNRASGIAQSVSVNFATVGGNAVAGFDYTPTNGILTFAPGEISKSFRVNIADNPFPDAPRFIGLVISNANPSVALGSPSSAALNIIDDESVNEPAGNVDTAFNDNGGFNGDVFALAVQPDGDILAAGDFTVVNNVFRSRIARLNSDGTLDTGFSFIGGGANASIRALAAESDGRVLVGGFFTRINGVNSSRIARLNADGTLDSTFNVGAGADNTVFAIAETRSGTARKILVGGAFSTIGGTGRNAIARLNNEGTVDTSFDPGLGANDVVYAIAVYPTNSVRAGQVLIGGDFTSVNGNGRAHVARLNADGSLDATFDPGAGANDSVRALALQADERILIGGLFTNYAGVAVGHIARLNANGTVDNSFAAGTGANEVVSSISISPDTRIVVGGEFTLWNGVTRHRITRLNPDGSIDTGINFGTGANSFVAATVVQPDGKIILGGDFTRFDDQPRAHIARIYGQSINGSGSIEFLSATFGADENGTNALITVRRNGGTAGVPNGNVFVTVTTSNGTAIAGSNYFSVTTNLAFAPGEVLQSFTIPVRQDFAITPDLTVLLSLSNPQPAGGPSIGGQAQAVLVISNDDSGISFSAPTYVRNENAPDGVATIGIIRTGSTRGVASVDFLTTTNGTALLNTNYLALSNHVVFAAGQVSNAVFVPVLRDLRPQGDTTVIMRLTNAVNALLLNPTFATLTIIDVEHLPGELFFAQTNYVVGEGDGFLNVTVQRTNGHSGIVSVNFATIPGTAVPGIKYITTNGVLTFADNEVSKTFRVPIVDNGQADGNQFLSLILSNASNGAIISGPSTVPALIVDNDAGVSFSSPAYLVSETAGTVSLTVLRPNGTNAVTTINYSTTNISAIAGSNYVAASGTLVFTNGETIKSFSIQVLHDHRVTGDLSFGVNLFNPSFPAQLLSPSSAVVTILDSEPGFSFTNSVYTTVKSGTNVIITVQRTNANTGLASVGFATADGTAQAGVDYSATGGVLTFSNGIVFQSFVVPILNNRLAQGDRTFNVYLTNPAPAGVAQLIPPSVASVTITDDISGLRFSAPAYVINENGGAATITVLRTGFTNATVSVDYTTQNGTGTGGGVAGVNYLAASGTLTFTNGQTSLTFAVPVIDNGVADGDKSVLLILTNAVGNGVLSVPSAATLTIRDVDGSLIVPAGTALTAESGPVNGVIDSNETVTVQFALRNASGTNTVNLTAALLATNGISNVSGPQNYGVLPVHGPSSFRPFTFTVSGTNGQVVSAILRLTDGSTVLSNAVFTFALGNVANVYSNPAPIVINDAAMASPYPSSIAVSGLGGVVTKATVTLTNINHSWPSDVDIVLVSPEGQKSYLMAKTGGGNTLNHVTLTFDDSAPALTTGQIFSGTNRPTAYASAPPPFPVPAPPPPYRTNLATFIGSNPNGVWSLYVFDDSPINNGIISNGWILRLNASAPSASDIGVTMTASQTNNVVATSNLVFTITAVNYGPATASNVVIMDALPAGIAFVSATPSAGSATTNGAGLLSWNIGSLAVNASATLTLTVVPTVTGSYTNSAVVSTTSSDFNPDDNAGIVMFDVVVPSADLVLGMSGTPNPILAGNNETYVLAITNLGPATATSVGLTNTLPPTVSYVSAVPTPSYVSGQVVAFTNLGNLGTGASTSVTIVTRPMAGGEITNSAVVGSTILDPLKGNNLASVKTVVNGLQLSFVRSGGSLTVSWPASLGTFNLESAPSLAPPVTWTVVSSPAPALVNGQMTVTLPIGAGVQFFRLHGVGP